MSLHWNDSINTMILTDSLTMKTEGNFGSMRVREDSKVYVYEGKYF